MDTIKEWLETLCPIDWSLIDIANSQWPIIWLSIHDLIDFID